jgi:hypothetical protein
VTKEYTSELDLVKEELKNERGKNKRLDSKAAISFAAKREKDINVELNEMNLEIQMMQVKVEKAESEKLNLERTFEEVSRSLRESQNDYKRLQQDNIIQRQIKFRQMQMQLDKALKEQQVANALYKEIESHLEKVRDELYKAEERNSWYEAKHNLCDAVKYQKKLETDIRRRDHDLKSKTILLGQKEDQIKILKKASDLMRESLGPDFIIDDNELQRALSIEENQFQSQNNELNRQIEDLEKDRVILMKRLRENAAQIGEKGMRFIGLDADQIIQIAEFAKNLQQGKIDLPLNDRSLELSSKVSSLNALRHADVITIERLEREVLVLKESCHMNEGQMIDTEMNILRSSMLEEIQGQNKILRDRLDTFNNMNNNKPTVSVSIDVDSVLSSFDKKRIERVIGGPLGPAPIKVFNQLTCFMKEYDKLESELSIIRASINRCSQNNHDSTLLDTKETEQESDTTKAHSGTIIRNNDTLLIRTLNQNEQYTSKDHNIRESCNTNSSQHAETKMVHSSTETDRPSAENFQMQVSFNLLQYSTNQPEDNSILEREIRFHKRQLEAAEAKIKRLKDALKAVTSDKTRHCEDRFVMAQASVQHMKSIIEKKNRVIKKYRDKCIKKVGQEDEETEKEQSINHEKSSVELKYVHDDMHDTQYISRTTESLVRRIHEASCLIEEKEQMIIALHSKLNSTQHDCNHVENKHSQAMIELERMKGSNNFLQLQLQQASRCGEDKESSVIQKRLLALEDERFKLEGLVNTLQLDLKLKDNKIDRSKAQLTLLNKSVNQLREETNKIPLLESETKRLKVELNVCRRKRDRWERAVKESKGKEGTMIEITNNLEKKINTLRKAAAEAVKTKTSVLNRSKRLANKLKDTEELLYHDQQKNIHSDLQVKIQQQHEKIQLLNVDNARLRGVVASYAMKEEHLHKNKDKSSFHLRNTSGKCVKHCNKHRHITDQSSQTEPIHSGQRPLENSSCRGSSNLAVSEAKELLRQQHREQNNDGAKYKEDNFRKCMREKKQPSCLMENPSTIATLYQDIKRLTMKNNENLELLTMTRDALKKERSKTNQLQSELSTSNHHTEEKSSNDIIQLRQEVSQLRRKLSHSNDEKNQMHKKSRPEIERLTSENDKLRHELSSFSLDFFEEIEDLKFKYTQAKKRLSSFGGRPYCPND